MLAALWVAFAREEVQRRVLTVCVQELRRASFPVHRKARWCATKYSSSPLHTPAIWRTWSSLAYFETVYKSELGEYRVCISSVASTVSLSDHIRHQVKGMMRTMDEGHRSLLALATRTGSKDVFDAVLDALDAELDDDEVRHGHARECKVAGEDTSHLLAIATVNHASLASVTR